MRNHLSVKIADIAISVFSDWPMEWIRLEESYRDFLCADEPEVAIKACYGDMPHIPLRHKERFFDSESVWSLYQIGGRNVFVLKSPISGPLPYRIAMFDTDFSSGEVYDRMPQWGEMSDALLPNPLEFPLSEVLMVCLLAQGRGLMVHSCGIDDSGRGYLFAGNSTHGKTTMARLWKDSFRGMGDFPHSDYLIRAGDLYMQKGESSEALKLWHTSVKQEPYTAAAAYYRLGKYYESSRGMGDFPHDQADWIRALGFFQRAIAADPKNIQYRLHLAQSYYGKQLFYEAIQEWKRALRLQPQNVSIHLQLARVYQRIDVQDRARQHYRQVLELRPENVEAQRALTRD